MKILGAKVTLTRTFGRVRTTLRSSRAFVGAVKLLGVSRGRTARRPLSSKAIRGPGSQPVELGVVFSRTRAGRCRRARVRLVVRDARGGKVRTLSKVVALR